MDALEQHCKNAVGGHPRSGKILDGRWADHPSRGPNRHVCATLPPQKVIRHEQCPGLPLQPDLAQIVSVSFRTGNWYPKHLGVEVACDF